MFSVRYIRADVDNNVALDDFIADNVATCFVVTTTTTATYVICIQPHRCWPNNL